jgi:ribosomal-protein-alanine N-acetyltransferase
MSGLSLDEAGILHLPEVMRVMEDSFDPEYGEAWTSPQCAGLISLPGVWLVLARKAGEPLGFTLSRVVAGEAELLLLAVRRSAQRQGVGAKLLARFISDAATRGAQKLHLEVRNGNAAVQLYKHAGFQEVGRRFNYYRGVSGQLFDAITLARPANS